LNAAAAIAAGMSAAVYISVLETKSQYLHRPSDAQWLQQQRQRQPPNNRTTEVSLQQLLVQMVLLY
jgi:hypothetical protein